MCVDSSDLQWCESFAICSASFEIFQSESKAFKFFCMQSNQMCFHAQTQLKSHELFMMSYNWLAWHQKTLSGDDYDAHDNTPEDAGLL